MNLLGRFLWIFIAHFLILASCDDTKTRQNTTQKKVSKTSIPTPIPEPEPVVDQKAKLWDLLKHNDEAHRLDIIAELLKIDQMPSQQKNDLVNTIWQREQDEGIFAIQSLVLGRIDASVVKIFSLVLSQLPDDQKQAFIEAKVGNISQIKQLINRDPQGNINDLPMRLTHNNNFDDFSALAQLLSLYIFHDVDLSHFSKKETMQALFSTLLDIPEQRSIVKLLQDMSLAKYQNNSREWRNWFIGWSLEDGARAKAMKSVILSSDIKDETKKFLLETLFYLALAEDIRDTVMTQDPEVIKGKLGGLFSEKFYVNHASLKRFSRLFDNDYGLKSKALWTVFRFPGAEPGSLIMLALQTMKYSDLYAKKSLTLHSADTLQKRAAALVKTVSAKLKALVANKTEWEQLLRHKNSDSEPNAMEYLENELKIDNKPIGKAKDLLSW